MRLEGVARRRRGLTAAIAVFGLAGCAQEQPPPGAHPDLIPPEVVRITPAPDSIAAGFDGSVSVRFNEPIQPPGDLSRQLRPSVAGQYEMDIGFSGFDIEPRDDWYPDAVYCFRIPAGISDLLRNQTRDPVDFCFSTGVPIADTRLSGTVRDPVTGQAMGGVRVMFRSAADTTPYTAESDVEGAFSIRGLPARPYRVVAFTDRNRDFTLDGTIEAADSVEVDLSGGFAESVALQPLEPDSTPPLLARGEVVDSITLRLEFDDALQRLDIPDGGVTVADSVTGQTWEIREAVVGEPGQALAPVAGIDSAAVVPSDSALAPGDSAAAPTPDPVAVEPQPSPVGVARGPPDPRAGFDIAAADLPGQEVLPSRVVAVRLARALPAGVFRVRVEGVTNLRDLEGGGEVYVVYEPPPSDSAGEAPDRPAAPPDSLALPPDSVPTPIDTLPSPPRRP